MKTNLHTRRARPAPSRELVQLRTRVAEAENTLRAIRVGDVDTVVVAGKQGPQVFTLEGAGHAYRMLIESMNEGALTLTAKGVILYANQCFARMVKRPLEHVLGSSFLRLLSTADQAALRPLLKRTTAAGFKLQVLLLAGDGTQRPAHLSIHRLARNGSASETFGLVVTDMTEARRNEELLRALSHRLVQAQESERGRVARELHDHITQLLCAVLVRCQVLAAKLSTRDGAANEVLKLRQMLGQAAEEVERISRNLRPSVLNEMGLIAVLRDTSTAFAERTGVSLKLTCSPLTAELSADAELALYRILQEALENVERHACARHVAVCLRQKTGGVLLAIQDDGIGFNPEHPAGRNGKGGLGLLGMRERATYVGGVLTVRSARRAGTAIKVRLPLPTRAAATKGSDT